MNHAEEIVDDEVKLLGLEAQNENGGPRNESIEAESNTSCSNSVAESNKLEIDVNDEEVAKNNDSSDGHATSCSFTYKEHTYQILAITCPIVLSEIFQNTLPIIDIAFVGNLPGKDDLAAAALATVWFNLWNATMLGFMTATDTMLAQSYGAKEFQSFAMWTVNSIFVVSFGMVPIIAGLIALCEPCMLLFGQDPDLSAAAGQFSYRLIPGLLPYYIFKILTKYLQSQNRILPGVLIGFIANGFNVLANWVFIYRLDMGLNGAPWATSLTRLMECVALIMFIVFYKRQLEDTFPSFSKLNISSSTILPFLSLALSGALSFACEAWSFEVTTILAGLLGTISLDAHIITLSIATFIYLSFPFAVGIATSIRVGQLIGDGRAGDARRSCIVSYGINIVLQVTLTIILYPCSAILGKLFSSDKEVSALVTTLIPLSCIFMMGDAPQANTGGAMRGLGRQMMVLALNVLGFWVLAVPVGALLAFATENVGVAGLWWGFTVGIYSSAFIGALLMMRVDWLQEVKNAKCRISSPTL